MYEPYGTYGRSNAPSSRIITLLHYHKIHTLHPQKVIRVPDIVRYIDFLQEKSGKLLPEFPGRKEGRQTWLSSAYGICAPRGPGAAFGYLDGNAEKAKREWRRLKLFVMRDEVLSRLIYPDLYQRLFDQYSEAEDDRHFHHILLLIAIVGCIAVDTSICERGF